MSCGLGAIILIFMLIKHNVDNAVVETELLQADLQRLQSQEREIQNTVSSVKIQIQETDEAVRAASGKLTDLQSSITAQSQETTQNQRQVAQLKKAIESTSAAEKSDVVENTKVGEQNYLMGLKVEGPKIAILLDHSSSMTDETLIDVIHRKNSPEAVQRQGPKWTRSKEIVKWLLARLPRSSDVAVIAFNSKAKILGGAGWQSGTDAAAISNIMQELDGLTPTGATNLQIGLTTLAPLKPTNVYIITDGLPTDGESNYRSLNPFSACGSLIGKSTTISGDCRVKLFRQTITESSPPNGAVINVILLPIEGDPQASPEFWAWTAATGGLLISPAGNWP